MGIDAVVAPRSLVALFPLDLIDVVPVLALVDVLRIPVGDVHRLQQPLILASTSGPPKNRYCVRSATSEPNNLKMCLWALPSGMSCSKRQAGQLEAASDVPMDGGLQTRMLGRDPKPSARRLLRVQVLPFRHEVVDVAWQLDGEERYPSVRPAQELIPEKLRTSREHRSTYGHAASATG